MPLPTLSVPEYEVKLPSKRKKIRIRPFLAKEQKVLLMAIETGDENQMYSAVVNILKECILDKKFNVEGLATFDLEYLMVQLRMRSVNEISEISFIPPERKKELDKRKKEPTADDYIKADINLAEISIDVPKDHNIIQLRDDITLEMKYPNLKLLTQLKDIDDKSEIEQMFTLMGHLIETIYYGDDNYPFKDATDKEQEEFIDNMSPADLEKMTKFFDTIPTLQHEIEYTYKDKKKTLTLEGLQDFFEFVLPTST